VRHPVRNDTGTGIVHAAPLLPLLLGNENPCPAKVWKDASGQLYVLMDRPRSNTSDGGQVPTISGLVENAEANTEAGSQFSSEIKSERKSTPPEGVQVTSNQAKYQKRNAPAEGSQIACDQSLERKNAPPKGVQTSSNKSTSEKKNAGGVAP